MRSGGVCTKKDSPGPVSIVTSPLPFILLSIFLSARRPIWPQSSRPSDIAGKLPRVPCPKHTAFSLSPDREETEKEHGNVQEKRTLDLAPGRVWTTREALGGPEQKARLPGARTRPVQPEGQ